MKIKGWRTLGSAAAVALLGFLASPEVTAYVADHLPEFAGGIGILMAALRFVTTGPVFNSTEKP